MNSILPVMKKELRSSFNSPIAYIAVIFFLLFTSVWFFFFQQFFVQKEATLRPFFSIMPAVFVVLIPALTMRSWAEERKMGTLELLATLPFPEWSMVLAKYLSSLAILAIMLALTVPVPLMVSMFGRFDLGEIVGEYLGVLLMGSAAIAIGTFVSSLAKNQISAFIIGLLVLLALSFCGQVAVWINLWRPILPIVKWISLNEHYGNFSRGVIDTRDLAYFVVMTAFFLYFTVYNLVSRKWR